jgi:thymidylate synthase
MHVLYADDVNDAWEQGRKLLLNHGRNSRSRAGDVLVLDTPVTTVYKNPKRRVLFDVVRDANPFFHLMEALWMLAGRNDTAFLDQFVKDFGERFAEPDGTMHGAYGYRWKRAFAIDSPDGYTGDTNQLHHIIETLKRDPNSRQMVLTMWNPCSDLSGNWKDRPCNTHIYFRVRGNLLDMTVCCRSNDIYWGAYGANAVHFSILQEYMAAMIGVKVGTYYQISNNFHVYIDVLAKYEFNRNIMNRDEIPAYPADYTAAIANSSSFVRDLVWDKDKWDEDLTSFMLSPAGDQSYSNPFFRNVAVPMYRAGVFWREGNMYKVIGEMPRCDWSVAASGWLRRRGKYD